MTFAAKADIIYFKDGMRTICQEKAWEENGEIKCEYQGWIISYEKKDVERILKTVPKKQPAQSKNKPQASQSAKIEKKPKKKSTPKASGAFFYDPRRTKKYWADKNSKHNSYKQAIQALANRYQRTPEWIQAHMGDTNDLEQIHRNLANPDSNQDVVVEKAIIKKPSGIVFYNPRRPFPYWAWETSKHKSYKDAIQALAQRYQRSPEWIKSNMGNSNDLKQIHQNLRTQSELN
jgi:hypothetical protein